MERELDIEWCHRKCHLKTPPPASVRQTSREPAKRHNPSIRSLWAVCLFLIGVTVSSSPGRGAEPAITIDDAVRIALEKSEAVAIARENVSKAYARITEARAGALPSVSLSGSYVRNIKRPVLFFQTGDTLTQITIGGQNEYSFDITLTQTLYSGGRVGKALKIADLYRLSSVQDSRSVELQTAFEATKAYLDVLLAEKLLDVARLSLRQAEEHLKQTELFLSEGTASEFEVLTAKVAVANARPRVIESEGALRLATDNLKRVLGLDLEAAVSLADTLGYREVSMNLSELVDYGLSHRPDIASARYRSQMADVSVRLAKGARLPWVGLFGRWSHLGSTEGDFPSSQERARSLSVGLQISFPISTG